MTTIVMYDSIEVDQIPANAQAVAGYVGGKWPTYNSLVTKFPNAQHLSIAVNSSEDSQILDVENGDASISDAPAWFVRQKNRHVELPGFYTSLSNVDALVNELLRHGINRQEYRLWSAHYTHSPHICGPNEGISTHANGTQFENQALARNLDASLLEGDFFDGKPSDIKPANWFPADEFHWIKEWERIKGRKTIAAHLRRLFLKFQMTKRRKEIWKVAMTSGWKSWNRFNRYQKLKALTK